MNNWVYLNIVHQLFEKRKIAIMGAADKQTGEINCVKSDHFSLL